jgi:hypothetical protein
VTSLDPATGEAAEPTRRPSPQAQPTGDRVNPLSTATLDTDQTTDQITDQTTEPGPGCPDCPGHHPCHDGLDCPELDRPELNRPEEATVTVTVGELARVSELLTDIDQFLRGGHGAAEKLADFYADRGDPHPGFTVNNLIDAVSFAAAGLRRHHTGGHDTGAGR